MSRRFPFTSFPQGWFVIAFSRDVSPGEVKTVHYFARDLVLFRTMEGQLSAVDKTCPHLGAHLGGGRVEGNCLRCPFHDWAFDAAGDCVEVPYAPKIPAKARLGVWQLLEQNGLVFVYFDKSGRSPTWEPPALEEEGWTPNKSIRWEIRSHPQEVAENTVDCSHLRPVHHVLKTEVLEMEQNAHVMRVLLHLVATGQVIGMPDEINDVHLDVTLRGLGWLVSETHVITSGMRTRQRIHPTPIDEERIAIFAVGNTKHMPDLDYTAEIDEIFWQAFVLDFAKDFPIWENKSYLERPLLAGGDGPIGSYRRWARQFYSEPGAAAGAAAPRVSPAPREVGALHGFRARLGVAREGLLRIVDSLRPAPVLAQRADEVVDAHFEGPVGTRAAGTARAPASTLRQFPSVDSYFDTLERRFDPSAAGELEAVFQWNLTGPSKLDHFAEVKRGKIQVAPGVHASPTVRIEMSAEDYLKMINGELNGALAFSTGRGTLRGPVRLAMRMQRIFPLDA